MRQCTWAAFAMQVVVLSACTSDRNAALTDQDLSAIELMTQAWLAAHAARDWNTLADMYTEDAVVMPPFTPIIQGRANIREWFEENEQYTSIDVTNVEVDGYGDLAYVRGTSKVTVNPPSQEPVSFTGKYLDIRRRDSTGMWRVTIDIFSPDEPVE